MSEWIAVEDRLPELDADNCCMDESDYGRYSNVVLVHEDGEPEALRGCYDGKRSTWHNADTGADFTDVTHWQPLPELPDANRPTERKDEGEGFEEWWQSSEYGIACNNFSLPTLMERNSAREVYYAARAAWIARGRGMKA